MPPLARPHIMWSQPYQPLTRHFDSHIPPKGKWVRVNPRKVLRCHECRDWRWAKYLKIRLEYDYVHIICSDGCYGQRGTNA